MEPEDGLRTKDSGNGLRFLFEKPRMNTSNRGSPGPL
jgi:hypothetical protein